MNSFRKPHIAFVRPLAPSFQCALSEHTSKLPIQLELAQIQHDQYVSALKSCVEKVIMVEKADDCPDSCFIEDPLIFIDHLAILPCLAPPSRNPETIGIENTLNKLKLTDSDFSFEIRRLRNNLDGGDVLQFGGSIFVGLSKRSTLASVLELKSLTQQPIFGIPITHGLHLKSSISALDDHTILHADHPEIFAIVQNILECLEPSIQSKITRIAIPDGPAANVLRLGKYVFIQDGFPLSTPVLKAIAYEHGLTPIPLDMSEFIKADGALTCCSVILP